MTRLLIGCFFALSLGFVSGCGGGGGGENTVVDSGLTEAQILAEEEAYEAEMAEAESDSGSDAE